MLFLSGGVAAAVGCQHASGLGPNLLVCNLRGILAA